LKKKKKSKIIKGQKVSVQINKIRNEKGDITTKTEEIQIKSSESTKAYSQQN
jgi:translation initiation factor IF-1